MIRGKALGQKKLVQGRTKLVGSDTVMLEGWFNRCLQLQLVISLALVGAVGGVGDRAFAQIKPDTTLGAESSVVTPLDPTGLPIDAIAGGAIRGPNLFHSFQEFNVAAERGAYFRNPSDSIQNILARVTGSNRSDILGTLGIFNATGVISNPNLFLINPNGIVFGPNASLDVPASFLATTANAVLLGSTGIFSASEPSSSNLLSVSPSALFFNALSHQAIVNRSTATSTVTNQMLGFSINAPDTISGLQVLDGQSLSLVGGDVVLEGGNLTASGGRIELGSVAGTGLVGLNPTIKGGALDYAGVQSFGNIQMSQFALVNVSGKGGGDVQIQSARLLMKDLSVIFANTSGAKAGGNVLIRATDAAVLDNAGIISGVSQQATGNGGNITIKTEQLTVSGNDLGVISVGTFGKGNAGNLTVEVGRLNLKGGGQLTADTRGAGHGGNLTVRASESVEASGTSTDGQARSGLTADTYGAGAGGDTTIKTGSLIVRDGAKVSAQVDDGATGAGGNLLVETNRLLLQNGGQVNAGTFSEGRGGTLTVNASDSVEVIGTDGRGSPSGLFTATYGAGDAGNLTINTRQLHIRDGGVVSASTLALGRGRGGNLTINASDSVEVSGFSQDSDGDFFSSLLTETGRLLLVAGIAPAPGGNLTINTGQLTIRDGAQVSTSTFNLAGRAGDLIVNVPGTVEVVGVSPSGSVSRLAAKTTGAGDAGNLAIRTGQLLIRDGAEVSTSTFDDNGIAGKGKGGTLDVTAANLVEVSGVNSGLVSFSLLADGDAGNLTIHTGRLVVRGGATVSSSSILGGRGGNLDITASDLIEVSGSGVFFDKQFGLGQFTIPSGLTTRAAGLKDAGNLTITTGQLVVRDGATVSAETLGEGRGGDIRIQANSVSLANGASLTSSSTGGKGSAGSISLNIRDRLQASDGTISTNSDRSSGGVIDITARDIRLLGNSDIKTDVASGTGGGGDIHITARSILAFDDSDILAFARDGKGGNITLNTPAFFGFRYRPAPPGTDPATLDGNGRVDVNASGAVSGVITLPDVSYIQNSLTELPQNPIDTNALVANSCIARSSRQGSSFVITGAGGLPTRPGDASISPYPTGTVRAIPNSTASNRSNRSASGTNQTHAWKLGDPIVEPQGVFRLADGQMVMSRECSQ